MPAVWNAIVAGIVLQHPTVDLVHRPALRVIAGDEQVEVGVPFFELPTAAARVLAAIRPKREGEADP